MTSSPAPARAHVIAGGFPRGSAAGHDIDYARLRILQLLQEEGRATASVAGDFKDLDSWLPKSDLLVTYVAGPFPDDRQCELLATWLARGGGGSRFTGRAAGGRCRYATAVPGE